MLLRHDGREAQEGAGVNYFPFHLGDYAAHTAHLEPMEDLAYRRLLDLYYLREGPLPADIQATAKLIRMRSMSADVESVLKEFFTLTAEGWRHSRCDAELTEMLRRQQMAKDKANKRWHPPVPEPSNAAASIPHAVADAAASKADANAMLPTPVPVPVPVLEDSVAKATDGKPSMTPDEIIFGYGVPLLTSAGATDKHARSFLGGLRKTWGDGRVVNVLRECIRAKPLQPMEWLAAAMPPDAIGATETRHQKAQREKMERDFPNLCKPKMENSHVAALALG